MQLTKAINILLYTNDCVTVPEFGSFIIKTRKARDARNPLTNKIVRLEERHIPYFKVSKILQNYINKKIIRVF